MPDVQRYLREDEIPGLPRAETAMTNLEKLLRERLSACRALLEKHQYQMFYGEGGGRYCIGCGMVKGLDCKPDCAIDAQLAGVRGGK